MRHGGRRSCRCARVVCVTDEVVADRDFGAREGHGRAVGRIARPAKVGMVEVDAGVDDGDLDADSGQTGRRPRLRRAHVRDALGEQRLVDRDQVNASHAGHRGEGGQLSGLHVDVDAVVGILHLADDHAARLADCVGDGLLLGLDLGPPRVLLGLGQRGAVVRCVTDLAGDRLIGQLDHHVDDAAGVYQRRPELRVELADVDPLESRNRRALGDGRCRYKGPERQGGDGQGSEYATSHSTPPADYFVSGSRLLVDRHPR